MPRKVTITLEFDPTDYPLGQDSAEGAVNLTEEMLNRQASLPPSVITIECEGVKRRIEIEY